ncbi:hypothetical protein B0H14DRAFT_2720345, partial [Mycena olivaceomarginata]
MLYPYPSISTMPPLASSASASARTAPRTHPRPRTDTPRTHVKPTDDALPCRIQHKQTLFYSISYTLYAAFLSLGGGCLSLGRWEASGVRFLLLYFYYILFLRRTFLYIARAGLRATRERGS